ncbi:MAG: DUF58 domain-containing protein [Cytophagales bacterium]
MNVKRIYHILSFIPLKFNFFVFSFVTLVAYFLLKKWYYQEHDESFYSKFLMILFKFGVVFAIVVIGFSFLSTIFCYFLFLLIRKTSQKNKIISVKLGEGKYSVAGKAPLSVAIFGVLRPILGGISAKLLFTDFSATEAIVLDKNLYQDKKWMRTAVFGTKKVWLPDRRAYKMKGISVYFEDFFGLFSFPFFQSSVNFIFTTPPKFETSELGLMPNKTEEEVQRIKLLKKIQGELINYKSFEPGDDIRRIVWKIFARNKELVIRTPETRDPYASHIYMYVSFLNTLQNSFSEAFDKEMLNQFKDKIRYVLDSTKTSEFECKLILDQTADGNFDLEENERELYQISVAKWRNDYELKDFFKPNTNGVLVLSSLISKEEILEVLSERKEDEVTLFIVKVSDVFKNTVPFSWEKLFFDVKESQASKLKRDWIFSGYRRKVLKNEKLLVEALKEIEIEFSWV